MTFDDCFREQFINFDSRKKVGDYALGRILGEGSFSKVRLGKRISNGEKVAIKIIPKKTMMKQNEARCRFLRETKTLRLITHKNIVRLYEMMETSSNYYLVMSLQQGECFKDYLRRRKCLSETEARPMVYQLGEAVSYLHAISVVHRDLKPENVIVSDKTVTIIDFGLSACARHGDVMRTQCGSPAYAAPEVFVGEPYTSSVDVWSLGVMMYLMLTGSHPFSHAHFKSYTQLYAVILKGYTLPQWISLSKECSDLLSQMLQLEPAKRISASSLLEHSWLCDLSKREPGALIHS
ncbi:hormonally up-regulated neu tumor-associated kinase homolog A-like isoform X2 [Dreissena polymorpha]|nr:hormonally up-regulated neu tumor-associated kinase homolog A-like isoform X2 [Dreissena polymorpha]